MGCAGPKASVEQQLLSATKAGFSINDAITIVAISQAESCGGQVYSTGLDNGPGIGVPAGNLQFIPANQNIAGCNVMDPDPQKALDCNFKSAYALYKRDGNSFCAWASYSGTRCPPGGTGNKRRVDTFRQFLQPTYNTLISMTHGGNDPIEVLGGAASGAASGVGNVASGAASGVGGAAGGFSTTVEHGIGTAVGTVTSHIPSPPGWDALKGLAGTIGDFFNHPKTAMARIVLFILGIFIAFEAVKHLSGSNSNVAVIASQNAGNSIKSSFAKKGEEAAVA